MANSQTPRDPEQDLVANAFSAYRAAAPKNFPAPAPAELMAKAETNRPRKRALTISLAALAFTGLIAGGAAVAQTVAYSDSETVDRGDGKKAPATSGDEDSGSSEPGDGSSPSNDDTSSDPLHGVEIVLPDWPSHDDKCPAGSYTFDEEGASDPVSEWTLSNSGTTTALDEDGLVDDVIVQVDCADVSGVIALEQGEKNTQAKAFVDVAEEPGVKIEVLGVDGNRVTLDSGNESLKGGQQETFVFDGDGFTEDAEDDTPTDDEPSSPSDETPSEQPSSTPPPGSEPTTE